MLLKETGECRLPGGATGVSSRRAAALRLSPPQARLVRRKAKPPPADGGADLAESHHATRSPASPLEQERRLPQDCCVAVFRSAAVLAKHDAQLVTEMVQQSRFRQAALLPACAVEWFGMALSLPPSACLWQEARSARALS